MRKVRRWLARLIFPEGFIAINAMREEIRRLEESERLAREMFRKNGRLIVMGDTKDLREDSPI